MLPLAWPSGIKSQINVTVCIWMVPFRQLPIPTRTGAWLVLLSVQRGVVDRGQALRAGFTRRQIEYRLRSGTWQSIYPAIYATFSGPLPPEARLWAAVRLAGDGAMLSHETAAEIHGIIDKPLGPVIHITVPRHRRPAQHKPVPRRRHPSIRPEPGTAGRPVQPATHPGGRHRSGSGRSCPKLRSCLHMDRPRSLAKTRHGQCPARGPGRPAAGTVAELAERGA